MIATKPLQEVIILGAGTSGLSIARCLLDKGIKPLLLAHKPHGNHLV